MSHKSSKTVTDHVFYNYYCFKPQRYIIQNMHNPEHGKLNSNSLQFVYAFVRQPTFVPRFCNNVPVYFFPCHHFIAAWRSADLTPVTVRKKGNSINLISSTFFIAHLILEALMVLRMRFIHQTKKTGGRKFH